jgi:hypothetical protein
MNDFSKVLGTIKINIWEMDSRYVESVQIPGVGKFCLL